MRGSWMGRVMWTRGKMLLGDFRGAVRDYILLVGGLSCGGIKSFEGAGGECR